MTMVIDGVEYVSAAAAAEQLETTEVKILMLLRQKALGGELIDGSWFVTTASLSGYRPEVVEPRKSDCGTACSGSGCGCH